MLRGHLYRQPGETSDSPPTEPGIMDLMAEIKLNADYKRASSAPVWLKGGNVLNGHHARSSGGARRGGAGATGPEDWPEDELGESNIKDLADIQVRFCSGRGRVGFGTVMFSERNGRHQGPADTQVGFCSGRVGRDNLLVQDFLIHQAIPCLV